MKFHQFLSLFLMKSHDQSYILILESIIFKTGNVKTNLKGFRLTDDFAGSDLAVQTEKLSGISFKLWLGWSQRKMRCWWQGFIDDRHHKHVTSICKLSPTYMHTLAVGTRMRISWSTRCCLVCCIFEWALLFFVNSPKTPSNSHVVKLSPLKKLSQDNFRKNRKISW